MKARNTTTIRPDIHARFISVVENTDKKIKAGTLPDPRPTVTSRYHLRDAGKAGELHENAPRDEKGVL